MRSFVAFTKKEITAQVRSGKIAVIGLVFLLLGLMNPAIAKLTPWLYNMLSESLAESGVTITAVSVSAMDSWVQFFKNMPIALIAFVLLESSIFTKEYESGSLILSLTKGLNRYKVVLSKTCLLIALFTVAYFLSYGITYVYNDWFWDNSVAHHLTVAVLLWWLFGVWVISLVCLFSVVFKSNTGVLLLTGGTVLAIYLLGLIPAIGEWMPTCLTDGNSLIYGAKMPNAYGAAIAVTAPSIFVCIFIGISIFNKKQM